MLLDETEQARIRLNGLRSVMRCDHPTNRARLHATVWGRVQGVNFRNFTADHARRLGLTGTVRNLADGRSVAVEAEGSREGLERLESLLWRGPRFALVYRVETTWLPPTGVESGFRIVQ
jgi:acylphosphatase